jgi:hypothetical protein
MAVKAQKSLSDVVGPVRTQAMEMRRAQEQRAIEGMTPAERDEALLQARRKLHEIMIAIQYTKEGEMEFRTVGDLVQYIEAIGWAQE